MSQSFWKQNAAILDHFEVVPFSHFLQKRIPEMTQSGTAKKKIPIANIGGLLSTGA